jgi:hypothetical protein
LDSKIDNQQLVSAGVYIAVIRANDFIDSRKMVLLK